LTDPSPNIEAEESPPLDLPPNPNPFFNVYRNLLFACSSFTCKFLNALSTSSLDILPISI
jgi:hypothetical protein